jgi:hypothetical protein
VLCDLTLVDRKLDRLIPRTQDIVNGLMAVFDTGPL